MPNKGLFTWGPQVGEVTCGGSPHLSPTPPITYHLNVREIKTKGYDVIDVNVLHTPQINKIPPHFIYEIKTKGYDVINVNVLQVTQINEIPPQKEKVNSVLIRV